MLIKINEEVKHALENNIPVVALESTIISHGMPYPQNVQTAMNVEKIIRDNGCVPATIGIIEGTPIVGMNAEEIELFGKTKGILKVSRRDLPVVMAKKAWGATTVSTTMILAAMAGIEVFVTGGIGGVHKGAQQTFDISADLQELAKTNVTVVCAGAKAILDLPLTLEYLETLGVPVLGYKSKNLAAFYSNPLRFNGLWHFSESLFFEETLIDTSKVNSKQFSSSGDHINVIMLSFITLFVHKGKYWIFKIAIPQDGTARKKCYFS